MPWPLAVFLAPLPGSLALYWSKSKHGYLPVILAFRILLLRRVILFLCARVMLSLEAQVSQLQAQVIELQQRVNETEILAALVDFSRSNPESTYKAAAVIGRDPSPFLHYIIINRGSNDDIRRGMPVVTNQGLVGRVDAVIADAARVQLITDPASAINVYLQNAETDAMLIWFCYRRRVFGYDLTRCLCGTWRSYFDLGLGWRISV